MAERNPNTEARELAAEARRLFPLGPANDVPGTTARFVRSLAAALEQTRRALEQEREETARLAPFAAAMDEDLGALIVALYDLPEDQLGRVLDAAQAVDREGQDAYEALASSLGEPAAETTETKRLREYAEKVLDPPSDYGQGCDKWKARARVLAKAVLGLLPAAETAGVAEYTERMTCPRCGQYGDGCNCAAETEASG